MKYELNINYFLRKHEVEFLKPLFLLIALVFLSHNYSCAYNWCDISKKIMNLQKRNHFSFSSQYYYKLRLETNIFEMMKCNCNDTIYFVEYAIAPQIEWFPLSYAWKNSNINQYFVYDDSANNLSLMFPKSQTDSIIYMSSRESYTIDLMTESIEFNHLIITWDKKELTRLYGHSKKSIHPAPDIMITRIILKKKGKYKISYIYLCSP